MFDFDTNFNALRGAGNCKWDVPQGVIPMSVADMDFQSPPVVVEALQKRIATGLFGYEVLTEADYDAIIQWRKTRHGETIPREHLLATPGVLNTMRAAIYALTKEGDGVIVMPPLHTPSITSASMRNRRCIEVPMLEDADGYYTLDFAGLEDAFRGGARVLNICSPNNPTGRVWTMEELTQLADLLTRWDAYAIADEIHSDIIYGGKQHISLRTLPDMGQRVISVFSPSKSFNFGGFHIGSAVIADPALRKRVTEILYESGAVCGRPGAIAIAAQTAAYTQGGPWLDALLRYLEGNIDYTLDVLKDTPLRAQRPEATCLMWVDCRALNLDTAAYNALVEKAGVFPDPGHYYFMDNHKIGGYTGMQSHFRMNIATPRAQLAEALDRLCKCLK